MKQFENIALSVNLRFSYCFYSKFPKDKSIREFAASLLKMSLLYKYFSNILLVKSS